MQFLYPLFLIAGLSLVIPLLIHLFNLRRYKTIFFPHTRFLKNLQLHSQKQSQFRYKWLLLLRILFLLFLIFAFAQPFFAHRTASSSLTAIYLDNSQSMSLRQGQRSLLDIAKENALFLINKSTGKFLVLSNDKPNVYKPMSKSQAIEAIQKIQISTGTKTSAQVLSELKSLVQDFHKGTTDVYYLSDFQQNQFEAIPDSQYLNGIKFYGIQITQPELPNCSIDTAYFESPRLQIGQTNKLLVKTSMRGKLPKEMPVLQLSIDNQIKSATTLDFSSSSKRVDTLIFQTNNLGWQKLMLSINDPYFHSDDSFAIAARSSTELSVLLLNDPLPNIYLQAALRSYNGFKVKEQSINDPIDQLEQFNLILISGLQKMEIQLSQILLKALQNGQNVCIFFGDKLDTDQFNRQMSSIADIKVNVLDTTSQSVASIQGEHPLVKEMFDRLPENVQLPFAQVYYPIQSGLSANQQTVFSFRSGAPFLASFSLQKGQLFLCSTPLLPQYGNLQSSYFLVPFLYQMASQAKGNQVFALESGQRSPVYIPLRHRTTANNLLHILSDAVDIVPAQSPEGMGIQLFVPHLPFAFYKVTASGGDTTLIAVNNARIESELNTWSLDQLKKNWRANNVFWQQADTQNKVKTAAQQSAFPLWKLCAILALAMLCLETWMLTKKAKLVASHTP